MARVAFLGLVIWDESSPWASAWAKISRAVGAWSLLGDKNHLPQAKHSRERVTKFFERKSRKFKRKISRIIFGGCAGIAEIKKYCRC